jgi:hypothetical protein
MDPADFERRVLETSIAGAGPELAGPVVVVDEAKGAIQGHSTYHVSTSYLVAVDEDDPELTGVSIAVPVTAEVETDREGAVIGIDVPADEAAQREARAYTRNLISRGEVRGVTAGQRVRRGPGPPTRPTHELTTDAFGRKVIQRIGFTTSAPPSDPAVSGG